MTGQHSVRNFGLVNSNFLAERLWSYRAKHGVSQREVAELLGVAQPTVGLIERGVVSDPHLSMLQKLAVVLKLTDEEILSLVRTNNSGARTRTDEVVAAA